MRLGNIKQKLRAVLEAEANRLHDKVVYRLEELTREDTTKLKTLVEIQSLLEGEPEPEDSSVADASIEELIEAAGEGAEQTE